MKWTLLTILTLITLKVSAQNATISGKVVSEGKPLAYVNVYLPHSQKGISTDTNGLFILNELDPGKHTILVSAIGYTKTSKTIHLLENDTMVLNIELIPNTSILDQVVVSGTMKEVTRLDSPVPVEVFSARFFRANPSPTIFEAMQNVNGVRPQINCNVCNTGDIHINGMEGPYTMVLIDGMPIVSGLATVYGLNGIPQSLIERVEVVKGPASTLYGSEAVGGLINVITKDPMKASEFSADIWTTDWLESNLDLGGKIGIGDRVSALVGLNYYNYQNPMDHNHDHFTDVPLQQRISLFSKWEVERSHDRVFSVAARYVYEDRWGGEMDWNRSFRGGEEIYGESIYTSRWELFGTYQLPFQDNLVFQFSTTGHKQDSRYGSTSFIAGQNIAFGQLTWRNNFDHHDLLLGVTYRFTHYDDNTTATGLTGSGQSSQNAPSNSSLPGFFVQDEITFNEQNKVLMGIRYDYNSIHGSIFTPRLNYKWDSHDNSFILRWSIGNGYRIANVFTEDHAALTGARQVEFWEDLEPETSWNTNVNLVKKIYAGNGTYLNLDGSLFYTHFSNKIIADYDIDPNKIIYQNLEGHAVSRGISLNADLAFPWGLKTLVGGTIQHVYSKEGDLKIRQLFTERFSGVWTVSYEFGTIDLNIDYTGNIYSPMRLPLLSPKDPRSEYSPWWSIQNIQLTKRFQNGLEIYGGIKNILNWTPNKNNPFIIARSHDPFDTHVVFDASGQAMPTSENPYGLTFDPTYVYGPNQRLRGFLGLRLRIDK